MKKILVFLLAVVMFGLGACAPSPGNTVTEEEELYCITGLNGQQVCYNLEESEEDTTLFQSVNGADTFDKTKAPSYMLDINDEYIPFEDVVLLLKEKYYGASVNKDDLSYTVPIVALQYVVDADYDTNEFMARTILLIEELRNYEFYLISSPLLRVHAIYNGGVIKLEIPLVVMINDMFDVTPDGIYNEDYEMKLSTDYYDTPLSLSEIQQYYNDYVTNETFSGYVLNY